MLKWRKTTWQVGLDIQNDALRCVVIQKKRQDWQLLQCEHFILLQEKLDIHSLFNPPLLDTSFEYWCRQLPQNIELHVALPASLIKQYQLIMPEVKLDRKAMQWYIEAKLKSEFMLDTRDITFDYQTIRTLDKPYLIVTTTTTSIIKQCLKWLKKARLTPTSINITPCALRTAARFAGIDPASILLYLEKDQLLWVSSLSDPIHFGMLKLTHCVREDIAAVRHAYAQAVGSYTESICYSSSQLITSLAGMHELYPFTAIKQCRIALPESGSHFALAMGLALGAIDRVAS